jgi:muconate cycloisomerase
MDHPRIVKIELTPAHVSFRSVVRDAMAASEGGLGMAIAAEEDWLGGDFVICKLRAEDGSVGLGEAFVWLPETGVSPQQIIDVIQNALGRYVLGESPFRVEQIRHRMDCNVARSEVAKGLLEGCVDEVPLCALIPLMDPERMAEMAEGFHAQGMRSFRLKLGRDVEGDVRIVSRARELLGDEVRLRVDYNQAYSPAEAVRAIRSIEPFGVDLAEQPVRADDFVGMAHVQQHVDTPLMSHDGCFSLQDIFTLVELDAVRVVGVNSERPGGVTNALRAIGYAEQRGLGVVLHNQPLGIASAMQVQVAAARHHALGHAIELFGHVMMEDDLIVEPLDYSGGTVTVPSQPGFGVELDEDALAKYALSSSVVLEVQ